MAIKLLINNMAVVNIIKRQLTTTIVTKIIMIKVVQIKVTNAIIVKSLGEIIQKDLLNDHSEELCNNILVIELYIDHSLLIDKI